MTVTGAMPDQQQGRVVRRSGAVVDEQADVLGGVENFQAHVAHLKLFAVAQRPVVIAEVGLGRAEKLDVAAVGHLGKPGQVVVVAVGVNGVADRQASGSRLGEVAVDVAGGQTAAPRPSAPTLRDTTRAPNPSR